MGISMLYGYFTMQDYMSIWTILEIIGTFFCLFFCKTFYYGWKQNLSEIVAYKAGWFCSWSRHMYHLLILGNTFSKAANFLISYDFNYLFMLLKNY